MSYFEIQRISAATITVLKKELFSIFVISKTKPSWRISFISGGFKFYEEERQNFEYGVKAKTF